MNARLPVVLSWSSGKDSAWTLKTLREDPRYEVAALLTTINQNARRVAMHAVREELLKQQAAALGLNLHMVQLPWPCSNADYEQRMGVALEELAAQGIRAMAFGDLFLEDIRAYREKQLAGTPLEAIFPIWGRDTRELAEEMIASGLRAVLTCVDPKQIDRKFAGRSYDGRLLAELPQSADPCGERGEFHTFACGGPMFRRAVAVEAGAITERDGFVYADLRAARAARAPGGAALASPPGGKE